MTGPSERDRIVSALDNLRSRPPFEDERHIDHDARRGGYFAACPLCKAKPEPIADALLDDGWVLRRADELRPVPALTTPHAHVPDECWDGNPDNYEGAREACPEHGRAATSVVEKAAEVLARRASTLLGVDPDSLDARDQARSVASYRPWAEALASAGLLAHPTITDRFEAAIEGDTQGLFTRPADEEEPHV